jgi:hypothetical protein
LYYPADKDPFIDRFTFGELETADYLIRAYCPDCDIEEVRPPSARLIPLHGPAKPWREVYAFCYTCGRHYCEYGIVRRWNGCRELTTFLSYYADRDMEFYMQCVRCSRRATVRAADLLPRYGRLKLAREIYGKCTSCGERCDTTPLWNHSDYTPWRRRNW